MKRVATLLLTLTLALWFGPVTPAGAAGTIFGLPLSQQLNSNGKPIIGGRLYVYQANSTTPVTAYADFGLATELPWPIETDADGRLPEFWLEDGAYRARFTDANGIVKFDLYSVQALGASSGEGGEGGDSVSEAQIATTGDLKWRLTSGTLSGWVRLNGRTIGSAASGATERANADALSLYEYTWNNFSNTVAPVTGGRGASAAADWAANKPIALPDARGRGMVALDNMGNTAAGRLVDGTPTAAASTGGTEKKSILQTNLPNVNLAGTGSTNTAGAHNHDYRRPGGTEAVSKDRGAIRAIDDDEGDATSTNGNHSHTVTVTVPLGGSGTALNTMDPYMLGTIYIKL